jgi:hypothetical protein
MLHYIFAFVILVHGFIHLLGFAHELQFTEDDTLTANNKFLSGPAKKLVSILWIISYALFLAAVTLFILYIPAWYVPAIVGVILSQVLIILDWHEARFGTITNITILFVIVFFLYQH